MRPGDVVRVLPGERIPVDGTVLAGISAVDESLLTGEAALVPKSVGAGVTAGSMNWEGPLVVQAKATGADSVISGIGRLVSEAQSREAPVQRLADTVAGRFCYGVMTASALTLAFWYSFGIGLFPQVGPACRDADLPTRGRRDANLDPIRAQVLESAAAVDGASSPLLLSIKLAVDVLVVACPCALGKCPMVHTRRSSFPAWRTPAPALPPHFLLGLATPTAVLVASSLGARRGLLIRGGDVLERLSTVDTVLLDKTGTLTEGKLRLMGIRSTVPGMGEDGLLSMAAAVETNTRHPIASAVVSAAQARGLAVPGCTEAATEPGLGATGMVDGVRVSVGGSQLIARGATSPEMAAQVLDEASRIEQELRAAAQQAGSTSGVSLVHVGLGNRHAGGMSLADSLRPDSASSVEALRRMGCRVMVLSGDNPESVRAAAVLAGIPPEDALGGLKPQDKADIVKKLRAEGRVVAMVGDGVNDAPALASADVGIALSGGLDVAGEAASVVLMGDRLGQVVEAVDLGRATLGKIRQNLWWALAYNAVGIPLAAGALLPSFGFALNPSWAGGMMAFSSIAVVTNSILLKASFHPTSLPAHPETPAGQQPEGLPKAV